MNQSLRSTDDPSETDGPLESPVLRYDLTTAQLALNPPILVLYRVVGVALSCWLVWIACWLRTAWSAWVLAAFVVAMVSPSLAVFVFPSGEGRSVRFRRAGAGRPDEIIWEGVPENRVELGRAPLTFLQHDRGFAGTVILRSIYGEFAILPKSVYEQLVASGMPDVPKQWRRK